MSKISGHFQISGQFQDIFEISGISGISAQLGPLNSHYNNLNITTPFFSNYRSYSPSFSASMLLDG